MHNGMFRTLEEVVDYYDNPLPNGENPVNMDSLLLQPIGFTAREKDLVVFLKTLTDRKIHHEDRTKK